MGVHSPTDSFDSSYSSPVSEADDESHPFLSHELHDAIKLDDRQAEDGCCTSNARGTKSTPIPKAQLSVLCAVRLVDPIMFTQIFPYVNEMMERLHITDDPSRTGLYSGIVVSKVGLPKRVKRVKRRIGHRRAASPSPNCVLSTNGPGCLVRTSRSCSDLHRV